MSVETTNKIPHHPQGYVVDIVGIRKNDQGRSCECHEVCGSVVEKEEVIQIRILFAQLEVRSSKKNASCFPFINTAMQSANDNRMFPFLSIDTKTHSSKSNTALDQKHIHQSTISINGEKETAVAPALHILKFFTVCVLRKKTVIAIDCLETRKRCKVVKCILFYFFIEKMR